LTRSSSIATCLAAMSIAVTSPALGDVTREQCIDGNGRAQVLRRSGKFAAAREELRRCAASLCPRMVRDDCTERLDELNRVQPTIVFDVKDAAGNDVVAAMVSFDGAPLAEKLDGSPLSVDPGPHTFEFAVAGQPRVTRTFVLKEGEKARIERIVFGPSSEPGPGPARAEAPSPPPAGADAAQAASAGPRSFASEGAGNGLGAGKVSGLVVATLGVGSAVAGAVYGLLAQSAWDRSTSECNAASCPGSIRPQAESDRHAAVTNGTVSTIGFVAGGALLTAGITIFLASPSSPPTAQSGGLRVMPTLGREAAGLRLQGEF